ncbi:hypothetical protein GPY51_10835 [Photorhabdus laumondii subsp. laumondii]|uniref:DUF5405 domain-containing protein n=1 Tax=Photorhabdus laumondii subsp. laumondii TaxID=141679 RepID=A0A6L9JJI1_PHOLM|nr:DUF5405 family protein [Photorhabdus laumondii]AWK42650.1 hypothetical protein A4R40_14690 [Photorhabdus laumondii subsp. laumondii]AXG47973.1 hypothetical protein PluTT01m_15110 [Photorhabdus laumondii subsp. laumondii]MCC8384630.1 DUF5405 family protein [Photorhabdus laumondii]MCC8413324.1 DUF5405 family protein [Photorhabdus laumondii]NDK94989.1 hypothetical protein [Photorhabdus laumondii subsp. laumondii]
MEIRLDKYVITSDEHQFILNEIKINKGGKNIGKERLQTIGYYPRLEQLIKKLILLEIRRDDIKSLQDISDRINQVATEISLKIK